MITFVVIQNNISFCKDKDLITCMSSFIFSNSIVSAIVIILYIVLMYFSHGTIFWDMLALPLGVISSGITISGGCGSVHASFMGSDIPTPPICNQLKSSGESLFFCTDKDCLSIFNSLPVAPLTVACVFMWIIAICMLTYYLTQDEDEDEINNRNNSKQLDKRVRRLSKQLEEKEMQVQGLQEKLASQSQPGPRGSGPSDGTRGWGAPGQGLAGGNDKKDKEISQLRKTNKNLEMEKQQEQQRANQVVYQLEQMKVSIETLGQEKEQVETGLMQTRQKLMKSTGALQQVSQRFEDLKSQNIMLQNKLRQVKTLSLMDTKVSQFDGQASSSFPDTPSAF